MIGRNPRPLKVGLQLNPYEGITEHGIPRWNDLKAMTQYAEAAGFDSIWVPDHLVVDWPDARYGQWECRSVLSALRQRKGPSVICDSSHQPFDRPMHNPENVRVKHRYFAYPTPKSVLPELQATRRRHRGC